VDIDGLGRFTIDDNSGLWDDSLPHFILEYKERNRWALPSQAECCSSIDKGWKKSRHQNW
jgi:hypothetical protein